MANLIIACENELIAKKLYEKTCGFLIRHGCEIKKNPDILLVVELGDGDSATFVHGCRDEDPEGIVIPARGFEQALDDTEKDLCNKEKG